MSKPLYILNKLFRRSKVIYKTSKAYNKNAEVLSHNTLHRYKNLTENAADQTQFQ